MNLRLRTATAADAAACFDLDQRCFEPDIAYDRETIDLLCKQGRVVLIAENDGRMIGFAAAERDDQLPNGLLITLDVEPEWRRRGVGSRLLNEVETRLRELGVATIYLHVYTKSHSALRLYKKFGYSTMGCLYDYYGPHKDAFLMARPLVLMES